MLGRYHPEWVALLLQNLRAIYFAYLPVRAGAEQVKTLYLICYYFCTRKAIYNTCTGDIHRAGYILLLQNLRAIYFAYLPVRAGAEQVVRDLLVYLFALFCLYHEGGVQ